MGVPDFVKFIARSSPGALCRLPKGDTVAPLLFDFILVDATNAAQTLGLDNVLALLNPQRILAKSAIIFALDSQRDRSGTARSQRHGHVRIGDLDVQVERLCSQLTEAYRAYVAKQRSSGNATATAAASAPHILTSGRSVAGEADYKLLDVQRTLLAATMAAGVTALPSFLFISEDSDLLCGALCGPAPQQVAIATRLQDVLYEPSILRLDRVLAFIATCTDAFYAENEREAAAVAAAKAKAAAERSAAKAKQLQAKKQDGVPATASAAAPGRAEPEARAEKEDDDEEVELSVEDKAVAAVAPPAEQDVVRRRKQDGPMVASGVRIQLGDSSSSDDDEEPEEKAEPAKSAATTPVPPAAPSEKKDVVAAVPTPAAEAASSAPTQGELTVSSIAYSSSVDMVFLFMLVMGNGVNVPSLIRGATKVDVGSCWQAYCKQKYKILSASEAETGRVLLTAAATTHASSKGSFVLNCRFLHAILDALHYADAEARPPGEEEMHRALAYLSHAVYATLRYVVGCNLEKTPAMQHTFLDSRPLSESAAVLPSLSAVMWVLGQEASRTFTFPLLGQPKRALPEVAAGGAGGHGGAAAAHSSGGGGGLGTEAAGGRGGASSSSLGDLDVGDHLVAPVAANAWAVRGSRTSSVSLATLVHSFTAGALGGQQRGAASSAALRSAQLPSVTELLKKSLQKFSPSSLVKANVLLYVVTVWEYALGMGVRRISTLTKTAAQVARAEGGEEVFTAVQAAASSGGNPMRTAEAAAAAARAKHAADSRHYVYSFELRRMAPVMESTALAPKDSLAAAEAAGAQVASVPSAEGSGRSAAQQAVLAALGVSYDYLKAPRAPENVVNLPHSALDDEDKAELQRLKKVAKKERALVASVAGSANKSEQHRNGAEGGVDSDDEGEAPAGGRKGAAGQHKKGKEKKDKAPAKKRLGKRERQQRQKAMEKAGSRSTGAPASA